MKKLQYAKNPVWADAEHTMINLTVKWKGESSEYPFTASQNDVEAYGREIFKAAKARQFGTVAKYAPPSEEGPVVDDQNISSEPHVKIYPVPVEAE